MKMPTNVGFFIVFDIYFLYRIEFSLNFVKRVDRKQQKMPFLGVLISFQKSQNL